MLISLENPEVKRHIRARDLKVYKGYFLFKGESSYYLKKQTKN